MQIFEYVKSPCTYQGGKQRVAGQIIEYIYNNYDIKKDTKFFDLCCGSGAVSMELLNHHFDIDNLIMLDKSSFGLFWKMIGEGSFDKKIWESYVNQVPKEKSEIKTYLESLSKTSVDEDEVYKFLLMQAGAFGSKQIYIKNNKWCNTSFRRYWLPTETSNRRSPVNPMHPELDELNNRVIKLVDNCKGLIGIHDDIYKILDYNIKDDDIIYIDPPYRETTTYGFSFDLDDFIDKLKSKTNAVILVSEKEKLSNNAVKLDFNSKKGGISGNKKVTQEEYLNIF